MQASRDANVIPPEQLFLRDIFDVSTNGSLVLNTFDGNYWDRYEGYDLHRDGVGDAPFRPVSLYAVVVERMPYGLMLMRKLDGLSDGQGGKDYPFFDPGAIDGRKTGDATFNNYEL